MRVVILVVAVACGFGCYACARTKAGTKATVTSPASFSVSVNALADSSSKSSSESSKDAAKVDFHTQVKPVLQARCQPCHFSGGKVYKEMPFDRPETIKTMGTKIFTRIKDENERRVISAFLDQK